MITVVTAFHRPDEFCFDALAPRSSSISSRIPITMSSMAPINLSIGTFNSTLTTAVSNTRSPMAAPVPISSA